jgi:hypothetical protein
MSVIPVGELPGAVNGATRPQGFWQRFAQALDAYLADRTRRAVPEITLRRSKHEIARCRRLMHKRVAVPVEAGLRK